MKAVIKGFVAQSKNGLITLCDNIVPIPSHVLVRTDMLFDTTSCITYIPCIYSSKDSAMASVKCMLGTGPDAFRKVRDILQADGMLLEDEYLRCDKDQKLFVNYFTAREIQVDYNISEEGIVTDGKRET